VRTGVEYDKEAEESVVGVLEVDVFGRLGERVDYSATMNLTNEEQSDGQRVSAYRLDIRAPFITAVLGDTTPYFTDYSINGAEVFGVHLLPQFGIFGMELLYGQSFRAVESPETFRQTVYGAKVKLGNPRSFQWGLGLLKVKDDADSIDTDEKSPTPKDNLVLGTDLTFSAFKDVLSFYAETNGSLFTADTSGGATDVPEAPSWLDPSKLDWLFIVNESTSPMTLSNANLATKVALKVGPIADNTFGAEYSYVGAGYVSLANPTLLTDRKGIRAWDTLWLLQQKLYFNLGFQYYTDNLQDTKIDTLKTMGFTGSTYVYPTDYLILGAGADVQTADNGAKVDTVNTSINGSASYRYGRPWADLNMYATFTTSLYNDKYDPANDTNKYSPRIGTIAYFTRIPLDSKAEAGIDVGDVPTSVYLEGRSGYRFLRDETLYAFTGLVYETGPELLDWELGANYTAPFDITFEADFEYITLPGSPGEIVLSAYATKRF
jgi:hypothetical protein